MKKRNLVIIGLMLSIAYASNSDVDTIEIHKDLIGNTQVIKEAEEIAKAKNMSKVDWEKMKKDSNCNLIVPPQ